MSSKGTRYPDNEFIAGLVPIKDATSDSFGASEAGTPNASLAEGVAQDGLAEIQLGVSVPSETSSGGGAKSDGWFAQRLVEYGRIESDGTRLYKPNKEYGFRPHFGKFMHEQVNYRQFADPSDGGGGGSQQQDLFSAFLGDGIGQVNLGISGGESEGGGGMSGWDVDSNEVGFEMSIVSDFHGYHKSKPSWNPSSMHGPNRSGLIISRRTLEEVDKGYDFAPRYFGRVNDIMVPQSTQDVKLKRVKFTGGDQSGGSAVGATFTDPNLPGSDTVPQEGGGGDYFSKTPEEEEYQDGIWKGAWNITPFDQPYGQELDQKDEHEDGPGDHGFKNHKYIDGYPSKSDGSPADDTSPAATDVATPFTGSNPTVSEQKDGTTATSSGSSGAYFQGGWLYDGVQDVLTSIHDIIGMDAIENRNAALPRWRNRFDQAVGISYIRHDAHFQKKGDSD
jgi:hypothetical protein